MKRVVSTVGLDLVKSIFQMHAISRDGNVLFQRKLSRAQVTYPRFFIQL